MFWQGWRPSKIGGSISESGRKKAQEWLDKHLKYSMKTTVDIDSGVVVKGKARAAGVYLMDIHDRWLICMTSGIGVANLGYAVPDLKVTVIDQLFWGLTHACHYDFPTDIGIECEEKAAQIMPVKNPARSFFANSGTEANEAAIKLLYEVRPNRDYFLKFKGGFAGRTLGSLALCTSDKHKRGFPLAIGRRVIEIPFPEKDRNYTPEVVEDIVKRSATDQGFHYDGSYPYSLHKSLPHQIKAFVGELVLGQGGIKVANPSFVKSLIEYCKNYDIAIWIDEVQTGGGRTGKMFATEHYPELKPDIITWAKSIANGIVPMGLCASRNDWDFADFGRHSTTFGLNSIGARAFQAVLDLHQHYPIMDNVRSLESVVKARLENWKNLFPTKIKDIRGIGLMWGVELKNKEFASRVKRLAYEYGVNTDVTGPEKNVWRIMPPLVIEKDELNLAFDLMEKAIEVTE